MHLFLLIYLMASIFSTKSEKIMKKERSPLDCKHIKVPPIEDPVCLRIKYNNHKGKDVYILAINKYEMEYIKCNPGMQAAIVPMYNCDDKIKQHRKERKKRDINENSGIISNENADYAVQPVADELYDGANLDDDVSKNIAQPVADEDDNIIPLVGETKGDDSNEYAVQPLAGEADDTQEYIAEPNLDYGDTPPLGDDEEEHLPLNEQTAMEYESVPQGEANNTVWFKNVKNLPEDYDHEIDESVDLAENKKDCPTTCAFRSVLVCAKCQHNIYRTFLSVCHLRVFNCKHPKEKLQLMKRGPCLNASPFNMELPKTKGRLTEPNDEDVVLKFINCRQNGNLDRNDPRCKFAEKKKKKDTKIINDNDSDKEDKKDVEDEKQKMHKEKENNAEEENIPEANNAGEENIPEENNAEEEENNKN